MYLKQIQALKKYRVKQNVVLSPGSKVLNGGIITKLLFEGEYTIIVIQFKKRRELRRLEVY